MKYFVSMLFSMLLGLLVGVAIAASFAGDLPDPDLTPGVVRKVTTAALCTTSTKLVRHTTSATKAAVYKAYGMHARTAPECSGPGHACYEIDHRVALEDGGADEQANLWPQAYDGPWNAHMKDALENRLHKLVCEPKATMTVEQAQAVLLGDWTEGYTKYVGSK